MKISIRHNMLTIMMFLIIFSIIAAAADAQVNRTFTFQGFLTDNSTGNPASGSFDMRFSLHDALTGGTELWFETQTVSVNQGGYSVALGSSTPFPPTVDFNSQYYLEIAIDEDNSSTFDPGEVMIPREMLTSVASAINADMVDGQHAADLGDITSVTAGTGLTGGGASGDVTLDINVPLIITGSGSYAIKGSNSNGNNGQIGGSTNAIIGTGTLDAYSGVKGQTNAQFGTGVEGFHKGSQNYGQLGAPQYGAYGQNGNGNYGYLGSPAYGVFGWGATNNTYGYLGGNLYGVYGEQGSGTYAGYFQGDVNITGSLNAGGGISGFSETDPVFSAWDKSTGISITESQISDLSHFTNANETDPTVNTLAKTTLSCAAGEIVKYKLILPPTFPPQYDWQCSPDDSVTAPLQLSGTATTGIIKGTYTPGGVYGYLGGQNYGVYGEGVLGVYGKAGSNTAAGYLGGPVGAYGGHTASGNFGYLGGTAYGVYGESANDTAVYGIQTTSGNFGYLGGTNYGVYGQSSGGAAGYFASMSSTGKGLIVGNGRVGIGISTPDTKLEIYGDGSSWTQGFVSIKNINNDAGIRIYDGDLSVKHHIYNDNTNGDKLRIASEGNFGSGGITILQNGNVGIGTTNPTSPLEVAGTARVSILQITSDKRFKKDIEPIENALEKVSMLHGVTFEWRNDKFPEMGFRKGKNVGLIAQEVEQVLPEVVSSSSADGSKSIEYSNMVAVLIEAVKTLKKENDDLKTRLEVLEKTH